MLEIRNALITLRVNFRCTDQMVCIRREKRPTCSVCRFSREELRALKKLAGAPRGVTQPMLVVAHGFSAEMLADLVLAELATVATETTMARRGLTIEVERYCITDAGRKALEG